MKGDKVPVEKKILEDLARESRPELLQAKR
jgi:hypothetical protein